MPHDLSVSPRPVPDCEANNGPGSPHNRSGDSRVTTNGHALDVEAAIATASNSDGRLGTLWRSACQTNQAGEPRPNLANAMLALREDPRVSDVFAYGEMERTAILVKPVPSKLIQDSEASFTPRPVRAEDVSGLLEWMQTNGIETLSKDTAH